MQRRIDRDWRDLRREGTEDGLELRWPTGGSRDLERVEVVEHADRVEIGIVERVPNGFETDDLTRVVGDRHECEGFDGF